MKNVKILCILAVLALLWQCTGCAPLHKTAFSANCAETPLVILDAGHGGADGGAVSRDGTVTESAINLQIVQRLALLLRFCGQNVMLTRTDEGDLSSSDAATIREQKVSDLKNRAAVVNDAGASVLLSIHQNSLPSHPQVHGAQVFYGAATGSAELAQEVQAALNQTINPANEKVCKAIGADIYLMREVRCTAVLVECGFLSNDIEARKLCSEEHQKILALAIAAGYLQYTSEGSS